jgi:V/A-type H+-transporting ATPase subunit I
MITKMKFLSITGPVEDIDRVVEQYLTKYDMHLENALSELKTVKNLRPFVEANPYKEDLAAVDTLLARVDGPEPLPAPITTTEAKNLIISLNQSLKELTDRQEALEADLSDTNTYLEQIKPYVGLDFDIEDVIGLKFVKYRFGRIAKDYYRKFEKYVNENVDTIFYTATSNRDYVYGVYFVPVTTHERIDAIFASLHFERFHFPDKESGSPFDICNRLTDKIAVLEAQIDTCKKEISDILKNELPGLVSAKAHFTSLCQNFDVRKLAARSREDDQTYFILCGWMPADQAQRFHREIAEDKNIYAIIDDDRENIFSAPPTQMKNPKLLKPFEMYTRMYGLPAYNEMDPTLFIALTYSFIFGWMFGDVGQGLCLAIGGFLLYKLKKIDLAGIIGFAGIWSTFFGFMFGSVFGFEDIIDAVWLRPKDAMSSLPFIGNLNTIFVVAIAFGMGLVLLTMVINIVNSLRAGDIESAFFSNNGAAGIVFYGMIVLSVALYMSGHAMPATILLVIFLGVPVILMAFKEPITNALLKRKSEEHTGVGMFIAQAFFELFEIMLSYFSNTLSFVRIGAFAVSHAAMMEVVMMLAGAEAGSPNMVVVVLGNIFVCGMEGLIVGIQVLRLEYYEFFSRFYKGNGREFKSYKQSLAGTAVSAAK